MGRRMNEGNGCVCQCSLWRNSHQKLCEMQLFIHIINPTGVPHFCEFLPGFLLNFEIQWKKGRCMPRNRGRWVLTIRNRYDIVLNYVSMAKKPLSQPKCWKQRGFPGWALSFQRWKFTLKLRFYRKITMQFRQAGCRQWARHDEDVRGD